jgi:hypothetical protein
MVSRYKLAALGAGPLKNRSALDHHLQWTQFELCPSSSLRHFSAWVIICAENVFFLVRQSKLKKNSR